MGGAITPKRRDMPSACFQSVDALSIALKHAKGMSLRYGVFFERICHHANGKNTDLILLYLIYT